MVDGRLTIQRDRNEGQSTKCKRCIKSDRFNSVNNVERRHN